MTILKSSLIASRDEYEKIKDFQETFKTRLTWQSIEQGAINNLKGLLKLEGIDALIPHKDFIRTLLITHQKLSP